MGARWMLLPLLVGLTACGSSSPARSPAPAGRAEPSAGHARACDRVASPRGDNRAAGTAAHPWRGAQRLANGLRPGMTGCLRAGTYRGGGSAGYVLRFTHGRVRVRSFPGERARLAGVVYVRRGANHVTLTGVDIEDSRPPGDGGQIPVQVNAHDTVLGHLDVTTRSRKTCVILGSFSGYGPAVDTVLRDSVLHDCGDPAHGALDHAVYASHVRGARIVGNLIYGAATYAVQLYPSAKRVLIRDNVLADNGGGVIFAGEGNRASSDDVVERNVIAGSTRDDNIAAYWGDRVGTGNVVRRNCLGGGPVGNLEAERGFTPTDNVEAEPGFVDPAARDYRLRQGSACIAVVGSMPAAPAFTLQSARRAP